MGEGKKSKRGKREVEGGVQENTGCMNDTSLNVLADRKGSECPLPLLRSVRLQTENGPGVFYIGRGEFCD